MPEPFLILKVETVADRAAAVVSQVDLSGPEVGARLDQDFARLCELDCSTIDLDLRAVRFIDGEFCARLLNLNRQRKNHSKELRLLVSKELREVLAATRLDRLLDVQG